MKSLALIALLCIPFSLKANPEWKSATLVQIRTINEWCRHCPDWNRTRYSLKIDDGLIYVAERHSKLDLAINSHTSVRLEKDGHIGDSIHVRDDAGKDQKLKIVEKIAP